MLALYNTLHRTRQPFEAFEAGKVTMYVCGNTVYSPPHIGNARPGVVFDVLARLLRRSYELTYVRNITDVDDKINAAAREEGIPIGTLTRRYTEMFHADMATLGVLPPDVEPCVTGHIDPIIAMIRRLTEAGCAYETEEHVLFSVATFPDYGSLSGRSVEDLIAGARVEVASYKRDAADFVLWKPSAVDEVGWDSPWGRGRPGWHIECSAMAATHLGPVIDIHGGGQDLVFPHHENEIAQSRCAHGTDTFARYWLHNGLVNVDSEKMSKSIGNVLLLRDLLDEHPGEAVRVGLLTAHYRQPLDWTGQVPREARRRLDRMYAALRDAGIEGEGEAPDASLVPPGVLAALEDDLNTPEALAELAEILRAANRAAASEERLRFAKSLRAGGWLLGLLQQDPAAWFSAPGPADAASVDPGRIEAMLRERERLRRERQFEAADSIRDELLEQGIVIEDRADGTRWRRA
ncbi:MAG TPA: cysteine--tRNA ligase [Gammaproteobacteria bacterium]|nr:cysteine--tRNA ligase [Gammaproteobacteria bacterium]